MMQTADNSGDHDAHLFVLKKEFAQCRAHYGTPLIDAQHCVIAAHVVCHVPGKKVTIGSDSLWLREESGGYRWLDFRLYRRPGSSQRRDIDSPVWPALALLESGLSEGYPTGVGCSFQSLWRELQLPTDDQPRYRLLLPPSRPPQLGENEWSTYADSWIRLRISFMTAERLRPLLPLARSACATASLLNSSSLS